MGVINVININPEIDIQGVALESVQRSKDGRKRRLMSICNQSKEQGFSVRFWEGVIDKRGGFAGINLAFKKIVRWAKEKGLDRVIIAEDDCVFSAPGAWQYYLDQMPETFDIYLGGVYSGEIKGNRIMNGYSGHTLISVHHRFFDFFLSANENDHLDRWLGNFAFEREYIVCDPFVVYQMLGYSDNTRRLTSHDNKLKNRSFFGE